MVQIDLSGKTALVTGASMGLGLAMARRFAASGANVAILARGAEALEEARHAIEAEGGGAVEAIACDVTDRQALDAAFARAEARFGQVDILVNNAGSSLRKPIDEITHDEILADFDLKLMAAIRLIQLAVPGMKARRDGRIINVSAVVGKAPGGGAVPTALSRAAGLSLTRTLSQELAPWNIRVNALCVGKIKSGQWERRYAASGKGQSYEEFLRPVAETVPMGRLGEAEEFANAACFLVSDAASYITGAALNVDGGLSPVA
ncbi:SDR family NAD(P)-dependent oxidoreductase [Alkalilacustris brevis]|uniref:SDR family NAD(P)-dependent oxidoreductase n=1 Tax=Alkalilacustris brevis TaxID=2026338 RepID=UPI00192E4569|nr:SDR family oxidoreductase [Alkalilacustris brevis]